MRTAVMILALFLLPALGVVQLEKKMYFNKNSAQLSGEVTRYLDRLAPYLKRQKNLKDTVLLINGHTDTSGSERINKGLSKKRACAVKSYLVTRHGIDAKRLRCVGHGASQPVADNRFEPGRKLNRRVVISLPQESAAPADGIRYRYDKLGRLTEARYPDGRVTRIEYDAVGNILRRRDTPSR